MNDNAKAWVAALRSGKYEQGRFRLRTNDYFCCLGVACDISEVGRWEGQSFCCKGWSSKDTTLPDPVRRWLGMKNDAGHVPKLGYSGNLLTGMNDSGASFEKIADAIEEHASDLFYED